MTLAQARRLLPWWLILFGSLFVLGFAALIGGDIWIDRVAVIGTAIGTLALAIATQALASKTEQSVRHSAELAETGRAQLRTATQELAAARDEAMAAGRAARAAEHAQIDALAPLLTASIAPGPTEAQVSPGSQSRQVTPDLPLTDDLLSVHVFMRCVLTLENLGRLPATVVVKRQTEALEGQLVRQRVYDITPEGPRERPREDDIVPLPDGGFVIAGEGQTPIAFTIGSAAPDATTAVDVTFVFDVVGPLNSTRDTLTINAKIRMVVDRGFGLIPHEAPIQIVEHRLERMYLGAEPDLVPSAAVGSASGRAKVMAPASPGPIPGPN